LSLQLGVTLRPLVRRVLGWLRVKTVRILIGRGVTNVRILDDNGNDIAKHCRRISLDLSAGELCVARLECFAQGDITVLPNVTLVCPRCSENIHCGCGVYQAKELR